MIIKIFREPPLDNNNYLIIEEESKEAALVDCSSFEPKIEIELDKYSAKLKYILLTHGHFDHIAGIHSSEAKVVMHESDLDILNKANKFLAMFGMNPITIPKIDLYINHGDILKLGKTNIKVIHTPGHTQGGVCYLIDGKLFSGDTIFREAVGRCDLEGGNFNQLVKSIEDKIFILPEHTEIYPGHGRASTVGWEKVHNKFV